MTSSLTRAQIINTREELWYAEPHRQHLLQELHYLASDPVRHRTQSIAIVAESNGGKSALVNRYMKLHPTVRDEEKQSTVIPAIQLNMTGITRVEDLSAELLETLGILDPRTGNHTARLSRFVSLAKRTRVGLIFLDEFHDCADTSGRGKPFLRCIKGLMNEGLHVVPVGTEDLGAVLGADAQLTSRFRFSAGQLPRLDDLRVIKAIMLKLSGFDTGQVTDAAVDFVARETRGIVGHVLDLTEGALRTDGVLTLAALLKHRLTMDVLDRLP